MRVLSHPGLVAAFCLAVVAGAHAAEPKPNIVFIMADDLGNADLGYRRGEMKTPNIDKLAKEASAWSRFTESRSAHPPVRL
jgi:arylsulfatase A-like enzyme